MPFPIIEISADAISGDEQLGSKPKFWFIRNGERWLFKERRPNTGEDWAEKLASDIARQINVGAAEGRACRMCRSDWLRFENVCGKGRKPFARQ
jgi:hypothetical protein